MNEDRMIKGKKKAGKVPPSRAGVKAPKKKYRMLRLGEIKRGTDEFYSLGIGPWKRFQDSETAKCNIGEKFHPLEDLPVRREVKGRGK